LGKETFTGNHEERQMEQNVVAGLASASAYQTR